jgi:hypothetical protein
LVIWNRYSAPSPAGVSRAWSRRASGPLRCGVLQKVRQESLTTRRAVRRAVVHRASDLR